MSYTLKQVDEAEARIRRECPDAHVARTNYDWSLSVALPDKSAAIILFDDREGGPAIMSDAQAIDRVIRWLKNGGRADPFFEIGLDRC